MESGAADGRGGPPTEKQTIKNNVYIPMRPDGTAHNTDEVKFKIETERPEATSAQECCTIDTAKSMFALVAHIHISRIRYSGSCECLSALQAGINVN